MKIFLSNKNSELLDEFCVINVKLQIAYFVYVFEHLNNFNLHILRSGNKTLKDGKNIFIFKNKI